MGLKLVPVPQASAKAAFESKQFDGFVAIPASILAFQWGGLHSWTDLPLGSVDGCLLVGKRAWDRIRGEDQRSLRGAAMNAMMRLDEISDEQQRLVLAELG